MRGRIWTPEEIQFLKDNFATMRWDIRYKLGRPLAGVRKMVSQLRLLDHIRSGETDSDIFSLSEEVEFKSIEDVRRYNLRVIKSKSFRFCRHNETMDKRIYQDYINY